MAELRMCRGGAWTVTWYRAIAYLILVHAVRLILWFAIDDLCDKRPVLDRYRQRLRHLS